MSWVGRVVDVVVEVPRGGFVKRRPDGTVDVASPLPVPWNYGSVLGELGGDGDPLDAIVLGPRVPAGTHLRLSVVGVVHFVDGGLEDDKLVCGTPTAWTRLGLRAFFGVYTQLKRVQRRMRGGTGWTGVRGVSGL